MSAPEERILRLLQESRRQLEAERASRTSPIAIVGIGCRFPGGAASPAEFWNLLSNGVDATRDAPRDRWNVDAFLDANPDAPGKMYVAHGGFLDDVAGFEPELFGISPREAAGMDPQQRILLEVAWEALENAGVAPDRLDGSATGVWMGICFDDYARRSVTSGDTSRIDPYTSLGNSRAVAVGRISYVFGMRGPAIHLDTSCSSSLVALHLACQSLRSGECDLGLAGGVNLIASPEMNVVFSKLRALSPSGRCKTFDASADGYARGEGCGIVVLKRLADAQAAGDRIYAIVRGSALNHDGRSNGLTAPNGDAQEAVIRAALANAGVAATDVDYVEAHGTGTPLGDPIEVLALSRVYGPGRTADRPLSTGSVKTNIGHLEGAAGVAALIKVSLSLANGSIPRHLHAQTLNPRIPWKTAGIRVAVDGQSWPRGQSVRRAGVSAFGMSGTNAHVIVEEGTARPSTPPNRATHLLTLSARTAPALAALAGAYERALVTEKDLAAFCATANTGRAALAHRAATTGTSVDELRANLHAFTSVAKASSVATHTVARGQSPGIVFLFSGQGAQYSGMARELYETAPVFRAALDRCTDIVDGPLLEIILGSSGDPGRLHQTMWTQPALFAIEFALTELWRSWGVTPGAVIGHSVGELVAATVAGVFSLEDGLRLVTARARAMQEHMPPGAMAAVFASASDVTALLADHPDVVVASMNGPGHTVVAGAVTAIDAFVGALAAQHVETKRLQTQLAFHSPAVDAALDDLHGAASALDPHRPRMPLVTNLTGDIAGDGYGSADYWCRHARDPVRFGAGITTLVQRGFRVFLEIGPTPVLLPMARAAAGANASEIAWIASLHNGQSDWRRMLTSLGVLWTRGASCDLGAISERRVVDVPTYPFQRRRFWMEPPAMNAEATSVPTTSAEHDEADPMAPRILDIVRNATPDERRAKVAEHVRSELAATLGMAPSELDMNRPLKDLGIDSLMLVALDSNIRADFDLDIPVQDLARGTATDIVGRLVRALSPEAGDVDLVEAVDLEVDAVLDDQIRRADGDAAPFEPTCALLTGATGFLGAFLLAELMRQTRANVTCLVRARSEADGVERVIENLRHYGVWQDEMRPRLSVVLGDLGEPHYGLSEDAFAALADRVDAIYNNGAHVSYVATYEALKPSHVGGTIEALRLATMGRPKAVHHISSIATFESTAYRGLTRAEADAPTESRGIHLAYSRCKWVSEALVRAARERGIPLTIHRPSLVSGASDTGAWNTNDFLCRMLKGMIEMGCMPDGLDLTMDFSPVDYVARSVVYLSRQPDARGKAFHLHHPVGIAWSTLGDILVSLGYEIEFIPFPKWLERLGARRDGVLYPLLPFFRQRWPGDRLTYIELNQRGYRPRLSCDDTSRRLATAGISCPPIDHALIERYVRQLVDVGFLAPAPRMVIP